MEPISKSKMKFALKLTVSLILLGVIVWQLGGVRQVGRLMAGINFLYIVPILAVSTADRALMTYKWARLLRGRGVRLPLLMGMKIYCASMVWGVVLPTTVGADAIRAFSTSQKGFDSNEVVASIIIERIIGFFSALLLGLFSLLLLSLLGVLHPRLVLLWWVAIIMAVGSAITLAVSFSHTAFALLHGRLLGRLQGNRAMARLRQFHLSYMGYRDNKRSIAIFFILTFVEQWFPILFAWLIALSLGIRVGFFFMAGALPLSMLISRIPIGIDGLGVFDGVFILLMSLAGVSVAESVAIAFLARILQIFSWLPWWLAHVFPGRTFRPPLPDQMVTPS
jgi:uncharacterized protein (TIRG00374 family)